MCRLIGRLAVGAFLAREPTPRLHASNHLAYHLPDLSEHDKPTKTKPSPHSSPPHCPPHAAGTLPLLPRRVGLHFGWLLHGQANGQTSHPRQSLASPQLNASSPPTYTPTTPTHRAADGSPRQRRRRGGRGGRRHGRRGRCYAFERRQQNKQQTEQAPAHRRDRHQQCGGAPASSHARLLPRCVGRACFVLCVL